jgi:hypothetical protein
LARRWCLESGSRWWLVVAEGGSRLEPGVRRGSRWPERPAGRLGGDFQLTSGRAGGGVVDGAAAAGGFTGPGDGEISDLMESGVIEAVSVVTGSDAGCHRGSDRKKTGLHRG